MVLPLTEERSYSATVHPFFSDTEGAESVTSGVIELVVESFTSTLPLVLVL